MTLVFFTRILSFRLFQCSDDQISQSGKYTENYKYENEDLSVIKDPQVELSANKISENHTDERFQKKLNNHIDDADGLSAIDRVSHRYFVPNNRSPQSPKPGTI